MLLISWKDLLLVFKVMRCVKFGFLGVFFKKKKCSVLGVDLVLGNGLFLIVFLNLLVDIMIILGEKLWFLLMNFVIVCLKFFVKFLCLNMILLFCMYVLILW